jgi:hypothetical protein
MINFINEMSLDELLKIENRLNDSKNDIFISNEEAKKN